MPVRPDTSLTTNLADAYSIELPSGASGEIPVERPTKFELIVDMKTAKAIGFTFPESSLARANRVTE